MRTARSEVDQYEKLDDQDGVEDSVEASGAEISGQNEEQERFSALEVNIRFGSLELSGPPDKPLESTTEVAAIQGNELSQSSSCLGESRPCDPHGEIFATQHASVHEASYFHSLEPLDGETTYNGRNEISQRSTERLSERYDDSDAGILPFSDGVERDNPPQVMKGDGLGVGAMDDASSSPAHYRHSSESGARRVTPNISAGVGTRVVHDREVNSPLEADAEADLAGYERALDLAAVAAKFAPRGEVSAGREEGGNEPNISESDGGLGRRVDSSVTHQDLGPPGKDSASNGTGGVVEDVPEQTSTRVPDTTSSTSEPISNPGMTLSTPVLGPSLRDVPDNGRPDMSQTTAGTREDSPDGRHAGPAAEALEGIFPQGPSGIANLQGEGCGEGDGPGGGAIGCGIPSVDEGWEEQVAGQGQGLGPGLEILTTGGFVSSGPSSGAGSGGAGGQFHQQPIGLPPPDNPGGVFGSSASSGGLYTLHLVVTFAVLALVALTKPGPGSDSVGDGSGRSGYSWPTTRPPRGYGSTSGEGARGGGAGVGERWQHQQPRRRRKRRHNHSTTHRDSKSGGWGWGWGRALLSAVGEIGPRLRGLTRRLLRVLSKSWHQIEDTLGARWRLAGNALRLLREAWATLSLRSLPSPHPEANLLATAIVTPGPFSRRKDIAPGPGGTDEKVSVGESEAVAGRAGGNGGMVGTGHGGRARSSSGSSMGSVGGAGGADSAGEFSIGDFNRLGTMSRGFLKLCGYRPLGAGMGGPSSRAPKYLLVLDLDETLVHCSPHNLAVARGATGGRGRLFSPTSLAPPPPDLKLEVRSSGASERPGCMYAWKRPHLDVFLRVVSRWYEVAVFTSGRRCFAKPLIDLIDTNCVIGRRFYRDSCTAQSRAPSTGVGGVRGSMMGIGGGRVRGAGAGGKGVSDKDRDKSVKDLSVLGSEHFPMRTVLLDNQPRAVVQQANVLPVRPFYARDPHDSQLLDLLPVLLALTSCRDVRSVLGLRQGVSPSSSSSTAGAGAGAGRGGGDRRMGLVVQ